MRRRQRALGHRPTRPIARGCVGDAPFLTLRFSCARARALRRVDVRPFAWSAARICACKPVNRRTLRSALLLVAAASVAIVRLRDRAHARASRTSRASRRVCATSAPARARALADARRAFACKNKNRHRRRRRRRRLHQQPPVTQPRALDRASVRAYFATSGGVERLLDGEQMRDQRRRPFTRARTQCFVLLRRRATVCDGFLRGAYCSYCCCCCESARARAFVLAGGMRECGRWWSTTVATSAAVAAAVAAVAAAARARCSERAIRSLARLFARSPVGCLLAALAYLSFISSRACHRNIFFCKRRVFWPPDLRAISKSSSAFYRQLHAFSACYSAHSRRGHRASPHATRRLPLLLSSAPLLSL